MTDNGLSQLSKRVDDIHKVVVRIDEKLDKKADKEKVDKLEERVRKTEKDNTAIKTVGSVVGTIIIGADASENFGYSRYGY